jgi:heat shock protein HslJ
MRRLLTAALAVSALAGLAACDEAQADASATGDRLWGRRFVSESLEAEEPVRKLMADVKVTLSFEDDETLSMRAGCNTMYGPITLDGGRIVLTDDRLKSTAIGCQERSFKQDDWLSDFIAASPVWHIEVDRLTVETDDAELTLVEDHYEKVER